MSIQDPIITFNSSQPDNDINSRPGSNVTILSDENWLDRIAHSLPPLSPAMNLIMDIEEDSNDASVFQPADVRSDDAIALGRYPDPPVEEPDLGSRTTKSDLKTSHKRKIEQHDLAPVDKHQTLGEGDGQLSSQDKVKHSISSDSTSTLVDSQDPSKFNNKYQIH